MVGQARRLVRRDFFIGAHAMAGTTNGFLDHTMSSRSWYEYRVNGRLTGEQGMWALCAGTSACRS